MKCKILLTILFGCIILSGCTDSNVTSTEPETIQESKTITETTQRPTESMVSTETSDNITTSDSLEESAAEELAKMDAVFEVINEKKNSEEYINGSDDKKSEIVIEALKDLAENGTEKYPESLVKSDSWVYLPDERIVTFEFFNGGSGTIPFFDPFDPYDPSQTDVTQTT